MKYDSIIFDLDGTLWDSVESVRDSWNETLKRYPQVTKVLTTADITSIMGLVIADISKKLFWEAGETIGLEIGERCCEEELTYIIEHGAYIYPELENVLAYLRQHYKLYIVSNCQSGYIESFFAVSGLQSYFEDYECTGGTGLRKDGNIRLIMQRNQLQQSVYVGDTQGDYDAAKKAGIPFIWASYGFGTVDTCKSVEKFDTIKAIKDLQKIL